MSINTFTHIHRQHHRFSFRWSERVCVYLYVFMLSSTESPFILFGSIVKTAFYGTPLFNNFNKCKADFNVAACLAKNQLWRNFKLYVPKHEPTWLDILRIHMHVCVCSVVRLVLYGMAKFTHFHLMKIQFFTKACRNRGMLSLRQTNWLMDLVLFCFFSLVCVYIWSLSLSFDLLSIRNAWVFQRFIYLDESFERREVKQKPISGIFFSMLDCDPIDLNQIINRSHFICYKFRKVTLLKWCHSYSEDFWDAN